MELLLVAVCCLALGAAVGIVAYRRWYVAPFTVNDLAPDWWQAHRTDRHGRRLLKRAPLATLVELDRRTDDRRRGR
jgi:hypothetical protein